MENQSNKPGSDSSKVINLFAARQQAAASAAREASTVDKKGEVSEASFNESMQKNMENAERLRKERLKANQGVLKSYRIKN